MKKLQPGTRLVIGRNSVKETLRWYPEGVLSVLSHKNPAEILKMPEASSCEWQKADFESITEIARSDSHQGIAAVVKDRPKTELKATLRMLAGKDRSVIIVLSGLNDPHHLGAVFRCAEAFAADLIVWSSQNCPGITPAVTKVAVGASQLVPYCEVSNINEAIRKCKSSGFWIVAAEPNEADHVLSAFSFPSHVVLVLGSEGEGIPRLTLELSDFRVAIDQAGKIDSVSLSQAAAVFLFEWLRQTAIKA